MGKYTLQCVATGREFEDTGWVLEDKMCPTPSLVRAVYVQKQLRVGDPTAIEGLTSAGTDGSVSGENGGEMSSRASRNGDEGSHLSASAEVSASASADDLGLYKFADWLPIRRMLQGSAAPVTYRSEGLAKALGLSNLWITFSGWNPLRGARMETCSFKETEAFSVCARIPEGEERVLVVASAGNTARAFARVCSENNIPLLLCVPADNLSALWFQQPLNQCVKLIATERGSDYFDAIHLSSLALKSRRFFNEGGAKNVARRDGMGTTFLSAVTTIGAIPDYYFQAVGSGTGAIAAWEANLRFIEDGRFGDKKCRLFVSQNAPFVPMYDAWRHDSRQMPEYDDNHARRDAEIIDAKVLSNRRPPWGLAGGLYDALKDTKGDVMVATNAQLRRAATQFIDTEGVDIHPAAAVATASLIKAVADGRVEKDAYVMLNITGGGEQLLKSGLREPLFYLQPSHIFSTEATSEEVVGVVEKLSDFPEN